MTTQEIIFSGSGGQGVILAGIILAAAALEEGNSVIQTQSYGPEARGGASRAEILISDGELAYPKVQSCNLLVALTQQALDKYGPSLEAGGILITDQSIDVRGLADNAQVVKVPIFDKVKELSPMVANILTLGVVNGYVNLVKHETLAQAVASRVPKHTVDLNLNALDIGAKAGQELKKGE